MVPHSDATREWGAIGDRVMTPSAIYYKPHIESRNVAGGKAQGWGKDHGGIGTG